MLFCVSSWIDVVARGRRYDPLNHTKPNETFKCFLGVLCFVATWRFRLAALKEMMLGADVSSHPLPPGGTDFIPKLHSVVVR